MRSRLGSFCAQATPLRAAGDWRMFAPFALSGIDTLGLLQIRCIESKNFPGKGMPQWLRIPLNALPAKA